MHQEGIRATVTQAARVEGLVRAGGVAKMVGGNGETDRRPSHPEVTAVVAAYGGWVDGGREGNRYAGRFLGRARRPIGPQSNATARLRPGDW